MMQRNESLKQKEERFREFVDVTIQMSEQELQAIHGLTPMTQELFSGCMRKCEEIGAPEQMAELIEEFPEQHRIYLETRGTCPEEPFAGAFCEDQDAWEPDAESLPTDAVWQKINAQLAEKEEVAFPGRDIV